MRAIAAIERDLEALPPAPDARAEAARLMALAVEILEAWVAARGDEPTGGEREGFRLLALHHQGARGESSFNACRETCREICHHHNLLAAGGGDPGQARRMLVLLVRHLALFVGGKMQVAGLGDFCCASRPLRTESATIADEPQRSAANA